MDEANIRGWIRLARALLFVVLVGFSVQAIAQEAHFRATADGLQGPERISSGYHQVTLSNEADENLNLLVLRMRDGASRDQLISAVEAVSEAFGSGGNPAPAINDMLELAELYGQTNSEAGTEASVGMALKPGSYLLILETEGGPGAPPAQNTYADLTVTEEQNDTVFDADHTVQMVDFAFALPANIRAGEQTWQVVNSGQQLHHMVITKLHEGVTMDDVRAWMEAQEGPPPADNVGYVGIMSHGISNWVTLDLTPGEYVVLCFLPDHLGDATGHPHVALGMMQSFTIPGE